MAAVKPYAAAKAINRWRQRLDIRLRRERFSSHPTQLVVEPTNRCDGVCPICARHFWNEQTNPPADLEADTLKAIEPFLATAETVFAFGHGEPLLAPLFWELVQTAKRFGCRVEVTTNGLTLNEAIIDRFITAGVDTLNVSMDAVEPDALWRRRTLDVHKMERLFSYLAGRRAAEGTRYPEDGIAVVIDRENLDELPHLLSFAADLHVRSLMINHLVAWDESLHNRSAYHEPERFREVFALVKQMGRRAGVAVVLPFEMIEQGRCPHPLHMFAVRAAGEVWPCCNAVFRNERYSFPVGNVHNASLTAIWNSEPYRLLRRAFLRGAPLPAHCRVCPLLADELASHLRSLR